MNANTWIPCVLALIPNTLFSFQIPDEGTTLRRRTKTKQQEHGHYPLHLHLISHNIGTLLLIEINIQKVSALKTTSNTTTKCNTIGKTHVSFMT